jgi:hypothetical protein
MARPWLSDKVGVKDGKPFLEVVSGTIPLNDIRYQPVG